MEAIVFDAVSKRASVRFSTVEQPKVDENTLRVSNLVLVGSASEWLESNRPADNPFLVGDLLLYPNIGDAAAKARGQGAGVLLHGVPGQGSQADGAPGADAERRGAAKPPLPLDEADAPAGSSRSAACPPTALSPGTYDLRLVVTQGSTSPQIVAIGDRCRTAG